MGLGGMILSAGSGPGANTAAPNPNPAHYSVIAAKQIGNYTVAKLKYHGCTNYEGAKILLLKMSYASFKSKHIEGRHLLDPHFTPASNLKARFEPTADGWELACMAARLLKEKEDSQCTNRSKSKVSRPSE